MKTQFKSILGGAAAAVALSAFAAPALALDLSGKTVTWVVPFNEGGGSDTIARILQPHLQEALPGNPTVLVLNQPGGGSVKAANAFQRKGATDGTQLFIASTSTVVPLTLGAEQVRYDLSEWRGVMGLPRGKVFYGNKNQTGAVAGDVSATVEGLRSNAIVIGMKNPTSAELVDLVALEIMGVTPKPVFGLSSSKSRQAFMRGETNANSDGMGSYLRKVQGKADHTAPMWTYGLPTDSGVIRDANLPDVPTVFEVYEQVSGKELTGAAYGAMFAMATNNVALSKSILLAKGTPDEIVDVYVDAFQSIWAKDEVKEALKKEVGVLPASFGADVDRNLAVGTKLSPDVREWVDSLLAAKYNASL